MHLWPVGALRIRGDRFDNRMSLKLEIHLLLKLVSVWTTSCAANAIVHILADVLRVLPEDTTGGHTGEITPCRTPGIA